MPKSSKGIRRVLRLRHYLPEAFRLLIALIDAFIY